MNEIQKEKPLFLSIGYYDDTPLKLKEGISAKLALKTIQEGIKNVKYSKNDNEMIENEESFMKTVADLLIDGEEHEDEIECILDIIERNDDKKLLLNDQDNTLYYKEFLYPVVSIDKGEENL